MTQTSINAAPAFNPYYSTQTSFSNDIFGSKYFDKSPMGRKMAATPDFMKENPKNMAQALLQQHYATNGGAKMNAAPTAQDYYVASQIANMFPASNYLPAPTTSFMQNDIFAQSLFA